MYFENGTLNPSSTTLADDLRQALVDGLTNAIAAGYTNWTITDHDYVNGTVTSTTIENSLGFAVVLMNETGTTNSRVDLMTYMGTDWTTATKTLNNIAFGNATDDKSADATGYSNENYTIPSSMPSLTSTFGLQPTNMLHIYRLTGTNTQTNWSIHVENEYLYFTFKNGDTTKGEWIFFGQYDTLVLNGDITDDEPYCLSVSSPRRVDKEGSVAVLKSLSPSTTIKQTGSAFSFPESSAPADLASYDRYSTFPDTAKVSPIYFDRGTEPGAISGGESSNISRAPSDANVNGYIRGQLPNIYFAWDNNANWGDTVQVNGEVYMYAGGTYHTHAYLNEYHLAGWIKIDLTGES